jgi:outer membrane protein OmpA-like peptidoglycan-associated protein
MTTDTDTALLAAKNRGRTSLATMPNTMSEQYMSKSQGFIDHLRGRTMKTHRVITRGVVACSVLATIYLGAACATTGAMSTQEVLAQYDELTRLSEGVSEARGRDAEVLAPIGFAKTVALLDQAIEHAKAGKKTAADDDARQGQIALNKVSQVIEKNRRVMEEVMRTRARAQEQGAAGLFAKQFNTVEAELKEVSQLLEKGEVDEAQARRPELLQRYADLELRALKVGMQAAAAETIREAERAGVDRYAPKTLENARQELQLVSSMLEADRTRVTESQQGAKQALWLALRATEVTNLAKMFDERKYSTEDVVLWYQQQLQQVRNAVNSSLLPFDRPNPQVVDALRSDIVAMQDAVDDMRRTLRIEQAHAVGLEEQLMASDKAHRAELTQLLRSHEKQLAALQSGSRAALADAQNNAARQVSQLQERLSVVAQQERRDATAQARYEHVRKLFTDDEAEVFRQGDNVLIRLKGFRFAPGKSLIDARNYALLNRVVAAINTFPQGRVTVEGHTDAMGPTKGNIVLSMERAKAVVDFINTVGGIPIDRLLSKGFGEDRPVATNETPEGRADNRRIDVMIEN